MKTTGRAILAAVVFYVTFYAFERTSHRFVRRPGGDEYGLITENGTHTEWWLLKPGWIFERKTRSLIWRVRYRKPLFGHVYFNGREG